MFLKFEFIDGVSERGKIFFSDDNNDENDDEKRRREVGREECVAR